MKTNTLFDQTKISINSATLSNKDKELWTLLLEHAHHSDVSLFLETFNNDPSYLKIATKILKLHIDAKTNPAAIPMLIAKEKSEIRKAFKESART